MLHGFEIQSHYKGPHLGSYQGDMEMNISKGLDLYTSAITSISLIFASSFKALKAIKA